MITWTGLFWWIFVGHVVAGILVAFFWNQVKLIARANVRTRSGIERWGRFRRIAEPWFLWLGLRPWNAHLVADNIWLGDLPSACDIKRLRDEIGVTHVVTAIIGVDAVYPDSFEYHLIPVCDWPQEDLLKHLDLATDFMNKSITSGGTVYVHCMAGVSRSATIVAAFLIRFRKMDPNQAIQLLQQRRSVVNPNAGFRAQLIKYHELYK